MPGNGPQRSPITSVVTCLPALGYFRLRPRLLRRISALPGARLSRRLPAPIDRSWSTLEDVRLSASSLA
jgi:hypothetical protein